MIRATTGNWANYATTVIAQVLFAAHFGTTLDAAAFTVAFTIATSISGILISVAQAIAIPRLTTSDGLIRSDLIRFLKRMTLGSTVLAVACAATAVPLADLIAHGTGIPHVTLASLLRLSAGVLIVRFVAGEVASVAYAVGFRLLPAIAPALPSTVMAITFVLIPHVTVVAVLFIFLCSSIVETALLVAFVQRRVALAHDPVGGVGSATVLLLFSGALLSLLPPLERIVAGLHDGSDVARYDYALRSLGAALVLVTGGVAVAVLASWSRLANAGDQAQLRQSVAYICLSGGYVLAMSAAVFIVVGRDLVAALYQHGAFTDNDAAAVTDIINFALIGYCAQGTSALLISALSSVRRTGDLVSIGIFQFAVRLTLLAPLAALAGVRGVVLAYSIGSTAMLVLALWMTTRAGLWSMRASEHSRFAGAAAAIIGAALAIGKLGESWTAIGRLAALFAVGGVVTAAMLREALRQTAASVRVKSIGSAAAAAMDTPVHGTEVSRAE